MADITGMLQAAAGNAGEEADPYFQNTVLLLHGDGNQGATNFSNTGDPIYLAFKDNSDNNFPITVNGDAYGDNFGPYALEDGNWSNFFDGVGDRLDIADNAAFNLSSTAFTIEAWVYMEANNGQYINWVVGKRSTNGVTSYYSSYVLGINSTNYPAFFDQNTSIVSSTAISLNTWNHIAVTHDGTNATLYLNGSVVAGPTAVTIADTAATVTIGDYTVGTSPAFKGYISGVKIVKGYANVPSGVPTTPATNTTGTSLLTCQSNRFVDNSTNNFAITPAGNVAVKVFNPFGELPDGVNGSGFFGGDTDYITGTSNSAYQFNTGDFTVECWLYTTALVGNASKIFQYATDGNFSSGGYGLEQTSASNLTWGRSTGLVTLSTSAPVNEWFHFAIVRSSGTLTAYINGTSVYSAADSYNYNYGGAWPFSIGSGRDGSGTFNNDYTGFISNFRVVNGTAVYTTAFTPPTSPLTAISGTELLTCQYAGTVRNVGFIDSGPYDFPITRVGNTTQGTFSPFSKPDGRWGNFFNGSTDLLTTPTGQTNLTLGTSDFTIEGFFYPTAQVQSNPSLFASSSDINLANTILLQFASSTNTLVLFVNNVHLTASSTNNTIVLNTWNHIAVCRTGGDTYTFYINGTLVDNVATNNTSLTTNGWRIGYWTTGGNQYTGYISNFRILKGTALYTGASLTVPTSALTAVSNTQLLTCQSNRFIDNSSNAFAITAAGDVKVTPFSPFPITTAYDPSVNGGAGYFDGSGDYLLTPQNTAFVLGTGQFSIEAWWYPPTSGISGNVISSKAISNNDAASIGIYTSGSLIGVYSDSHYATSAFTSGQWLHLVASRDASSQLRFFINGKLVGTQASWSQNKTIDEFAIGSLTGGGETITGYISNVRIYKGGIPTEYQTASTTTGTQIFTPPTAPLTAIANTSLLCNFTNAGILDNTGFNALETVGNAQIDTSVKKYGTGAMKFDGAGDYLAVPNSVELDQIGDFTHECWYYRTGSGQGTLDKIFIKNITNYLYLAIKKSDSNKVTVNQHNIGTFITGTTQTATNTWYHIAVTRSGSDVKLFVNGVQEGSTRTYSTNTSGSAVSYIGGFPAAHSIEGYIDDLRITKGVARYTANFTPPDKAFPDIGE